MKLLVISPEADDPREQRAVQRMLSEGLERYHFRKPSWSREKAEAFLRAFAPVERARIVVHQHPELVAPLGLRGAHRKDWQVAAKKDTAATSCACHDLAALTRAWGVYETVLLSPIFDSISKPGYGSAFDWAELSRVLRGRDARARRTAVMALGGINPANTRRARDLGFDGVAALGFVWQAADPLEAFRALRRVCDERPVPRAAAAAGVGGVR